MGRERKVISVVLRLVIGGLFIWAGAVKAVDPSQFAVDVHNFQLLPWDWSVIVAFYLPWLEIVAGSTLIFTRWHPEPAAVLLMLTVVFAVALGAAWWRGLDISCGCFGSSPPGTVVQALVRDLALMAAIGALLAVDPERRPSRRQP